MAINRDSCGPPLWARLFWWTIYATAFGYLEAIVVVYLRRIAGIGPGLSYISIWAARGMPLDSAHITGQMRHYGLIAPELSREAATLLLLLGAAWASGRGLREKWAIFAYTFAI